MPWNKHVQAGRDLIRRAFEGAKKIGDLTYAAYSCDNLNTNLLAAGDPLVEVQREAENGLEFAEKARFGLVIDIITGQLGLIRTLRGLTPKFGSFDHGQFDELRFERHLASNPVLALPELEYWTRKLQARFFAGDYASAVDASLRAQRLLWSSPSLFRTAEYHFYGALARAASCDSAAAGQRQQHFEALCAHHEQLKVWAEHCPENFETRAALVGAEIARIEGRALDAMDLYEQAIRSACANGFVHNEAVANELAAYFYAARGFRQIAHLYLRNARHCYLRWGAFGKVRQLDELYPHLSEGQLAPDSRRTIGAPVEQLDLETVIKASQAVSGEIVLESLIKTLMVIAVEHAGAERGLLILPRGQEHRIEAEARTRHESVEVSFRQCLVTPSELPESLLRYVIRTRQSVILDDASVQNQFSEDEYLRQRGSRSVLCLALVKQAKLIGVLYLENNLAPCVFTSRRLEMLKLLASQAAISLDHAQLYADLRRSEAYLATANEALRKSLDALASVPELDDFLGQVMAVITRQLGAVSSTLRVLNLDQNSLTMELLFQDGRVMSPTEAKFPESWRSLSLDEQHAATFLDQPTTVARILDPQSPIPEALRFYLFGLGIRTLLIIPLTLGGQANGQLSFRFTEERDFDPAELEIARALATQASLAIQLTQLAKTAKQSAVLEERNQLAGEIHDSLAQFFTGIAMQPGVAKEALKTGDLLALGYLERASELAHFGLAEARRSAFSLQPSLTEGSGLIETLQKLVQRSNIPGRLCCNFHSTGVPEESLPPPVHKDLLRIAQEAISNAVRHARPTVISVNLRSEPPASLVLEVTDNGSGITDSQAASREGFGFSNMTARVKKLNGTLDIRTAPSRGTSIIVSVPVNG